MNLIRIVISCCCLAGITTICQGQKFRDVSNLKTKYLKSETSQYEFGYKIPFKKIEVIDFRFDTSKIGYAIYHSTENHTKFVAPGGLQDFLNKRLNLYFKNNLDPSSSIFGSATYIELIDVNNLEEVGVNRTGGAKFI